MKNAMYACASILFLAATTFFFTATYLAVTERRRFEDHASRKNADDHVVAVWTKKSGEALARIADKCAAIKQ